MKTLKTRDELLAELAELQAANEAATSWGAAVGARHERIKQIQSTLRHPPAPPMSPHTDPGALLKLADDVAAISPRLANEADREIVIKSASAIRSLELNLREARQAASQGSAGGEIDIEHAFIEVCDELGCAYDNESPLIEIANLRQRAGLPRSEVLIGVDLASAIDSPTTLALAKVFSPLNTSVKSFSEQIVEILATRIPTAAQAGQVPSRNAALEECLIIVDRHLQGHAGPQYRAACENIGREIAALCSVPSASRGTEA